MWEVTDGHVDHCGAEERPGPRCGVVADGDDQNVVQGAEVGDEAVDEGNDTLATRWVDPTRYDEHDPHRDSLAEARAWARQKGYGQFTQAAESSDGVHFTVRPAVTRTSYLRVFPFQGYVYGVSRLGLLSRSADPLGTFELGGNAFRDGPYANRVRHVALVRRGDRLHVFFTGIGDAPERVLMSTIALTEDWTTWKATSPVEVLAPQTEYECAKLPNVASEAGDIEARVRQMRDPFVFEEEGRAFLFYTTCGEQGIAGATISLP